LKSLIESEPNEPLKDEEAKAKIKVESKEMASCHRLIYLQLVKRRDEKESICGQ